MRTTWGVAGVTCALIVLFGACGDNLRSGETGLIQITPVSGLVTTEQGGQATFTVALTAKPSSDVTIPLSSTNLSQGTIDQTSLTFSSDDWETPRTVTITGVDDGVHDGNVTYAIETGVTASADVMYSGVDADDVSVTNLGRALVRLELTPVNPAIALGTTQQFTATGVFDDTSTLDLTTAVAWSSATGTVATISNATGMNGRASALATGTSAISATMGTVTAQTTLTVTQATLVSIQVTPSNTSIAKGTTQSFTATGVYSDNTTQDLTTQVLWSSSMPFVATISNASGSQGRASALNTGTTTIAAMLGTTTGSTTLTVTAATLVSIDVTPVNPTIADGSTQQFQATGVYSDGSTQPLTSQATWASTTPGVATISNVPGSNGLATAVDPGSTTITATADGRVGSTLLTVTAATLVSIQVTPPNPSTTKASTVQFTATGVYTDGSNQDLTTQVAWSSSADTIATISNATGSKGLATAQDVGQATITATLGAVSGSTTLTVTAATLVSVQIAPLGATAAKGTTVQYTLTGFFSDNSTQDLTTQATWSSMFGIIATISNAAGSEGLATAESVGATTISGTFGGMTASTTLTVTAPVLVSVQITPTNPTIAKGTNIQFTATAVFSDGSTQNVTSLTTWASTVTTVATIGNAPGNRGRANGQNQGTTTIVGTFNGVSGSTTLTVTAATLQSIQVTPTNPSAAKGTTLQFTATGTYSDGTTQNLTTDVTWSSSTLAVATISNAAGSQGRASAIDQGTTTISATLGGRTGSTTLTVTAAALVSIQVTPTNPSAAAGTGVQFTATGTYTDNTTQNITTQVTWSSSTGAVASISNAPGSQGRANALTTGSTTISATLGGFSGSTTLTVTAATLVSVSIEPTNPSIADGTTLQFTATGTYSDNSTQDLTDDATWSSTTIAVAQISTATGSKGLATAIDPGSTTISATFGGATGSTTLTVTGATLASIAVTPTNPSIADGTSQQFTATGTFTDGSTQNLTGVASWSSMTSTVATVSSVDGSRGFATAVAPGTTEIVAMVGTLSGSTTLTVTAATLVSIQVAPGSASIADGTTQQFTAIGTYSDGSTQNLTDDATWSSTNVAAAQISTAAGTEGLATAIDPGSTTISATSGGVTGTATLTVTMATLVSIAVTPTNPSIADGTTQQFTATGTYTDSSTQNLTASATWSSTTSTIATVSNASGSKGFATAVAQGTTMIVATVGTVSGSTTLTVTAATLVSLQVTPTDPEIADGTTLELSVFGLYTDGSIQDHTDEASWSSSNSNTATVSNSTGSEGLAVSVNPGTTTITAIFGGMADSTVLTVTPATLVSISVTPPNPSIANGTTQQFTATGLFTDNTTQDLTAAATWSSTDNSVATVGANTGLANGVGTGTTSISATFQGVTGSTSLTVTGVVLTSVVVTPGTTTMTIGATVQFTCTGVYSDNSTQDLTASALWDSSNSAAATVSNAAGSEGVATAVAVGSANISCTEGGFTDFSTVNVIAQAVTIVVSPANPTMAAGLQRQFTATITVNGIVEDITESAVWTSSDTDVATISNQLGFEGIATSANVGTTTITANFGGSSGSTLLTVNNATLVSIALVPLNATIAKNTTIAFQAIGTFTDGSLQDITTVATWASSNQTVATISNAAGSNGEATGVLAGTTTISATFQGITGSTTLTVSNAVLVSISIEPPNPVMTVGQTLQLRAIGLFSDGTTQDLTLQSNWKSQNKQVAKVFQGRRKRGMATAIGVGTSIVTATTLGISGLTTITVTP